MKKLLLLLIAISFLIGCSDDDDKNVTLVNNSSFDWVKVVVRTDQIYPDKDNIMEVGSIKKGQSRSFECYFYTIKSISVYESPEKRKFCIKDFKLENEGHVEIKLSDNDLTTPSE